MLIALCSDKGSPGVTTSALALASGWSQSAVVVEADPAGGDLGIRLHPGGTALPEAPTVLTLAAASRTDTAPDFVERHTQRLNSRVSVVPAPMRSELMAKIGDWSTVADVLRRSQTAVIADLGRLHRASPVLPIAAAADVLVVVGRPDMTSVIRLRDRLARLGPDLGAVRDAPPKLFALLISPTRHGSAHARDLSLLLDETAAKPFMVGTGFLGLDPGAVRKLEAGGDPAGRLTRSNLLRTARAAAAELASIDDPSAGAKHVTAVGGGR